MIKEKTVYQTDDGSMFDSYADAVAHTKKSALSEQIDVFMGQPMAAGLKPSEKVLVRSAIIEWERTAPAPNEETEAAPAAEPAPPQR